MLLSAALADNVALGSQIRCCEASGKLCMAFRCPRQQHSTAAQASATIIHKRDRC